MAMVPFCPCCKVRQLTFNIKQLSEGVWFLHRNGEQTACTVASGGNKFLMLTSLSVSNESQHL